MIFIGDFLADETSLNPTATDVSNLKYIRIKSGVYDELFISKNTAFNYSTTIPVDWDFDTICHALFNGSLHGGNVEFTANQVSHIRVKRRKLNTYEWITLFEIPIFSREDFSFERYDRFARSGIEYEYAIVPVLNGIEGNINTNNILSEFDGIFIIEKEKIFNTILNVANQVQKNRPTATINTLGSKYPYVISNGESNYYSGATSGTFIEYDNLNCDWKVEQGREHREELMEFLQNGRPKIYKDEDGRMWIICIVDTVSEDSSSHHQMPITSFSWVETGNADSGHDLYINGLIDVDLEGR